MDDKQVIEKYARELMAWIYSLTPSDNDVSAYFERFCKNVSSLHSSKLEIYFDERVVKSILCLLDTLKFQSFDTCSYLCKNRRLLGLIALHLFSEKYINRRHYEQIKIKQQQCILHQRIQPFLDIAQTKQDKSRQRLKQIWKICVKFDIVDFWFWIIENQIKHPILTYLYEHTVFMGQQLPEDVLGSNHFQDIQKQYENGRWFDEQQKKSQLDTHYLSKYSQEEDINKILNEIALEASLCLNKNYSPIVQAIKMFVRYLSDQLFPQKNEYFQFFGSLRNKMALMDNFDIDLTVIFSKQRQINYDYSIKENDFQYLKKLKAKIQYQQFDWLQQCYIGTSEAPVAYMKLSVNTSVMDRRFGIPNLQKMDLTVENRNAIVNSEFISKFAEKKEVLAFCLLIKRWAKNVNVINAEHPMEGLSGFGVILMCLFYLMSTKQIDFAKRQSRVRVERCDMKELNENLYNFYRFYSKQGEFRKKRMTVCLVQNMQNHYIYDQKLIINMYDHLSDTNPGRLTIDYKRNFDSQFNKAIQIFESRDQERIMALFQDKQRK